MVEDSFLTQAVTQLTHVDNILDLVLASDPDFIGDREVHEKLNFCDHHLIHFSTKMNIAFTENNVKVHDYKKVDLRIA